MANAIDQFSNGPDETAQESLIFEATAAQTGFVRLVELGQRLEVTVPLATVSEEFLRGITTGDRELAVHAYSGAEMLISRLREQFGEDLGRSWNTQAIDWEFDQVINASAILVDRLSHENLTATDIANTYELAVKIAHGWMRLVHGSYFLIYSEPYSKAAETIVLGMRNHRPTEVRAGTETMTALATRLSLGSASIVTGEQPRKGDPVAYANGVPGGRYLATADGSPMEGFPDQWSVEVVLCDPRKTASSVTRRR
ncbi:MAG: hypothetical protein ABSG36_07365 [Acidimicrobiales bacterium]